MSRMTAIVVISCGKFAALSAVGVALVVEGHHWIALIPVAALAWFSDVSLTSSTKITKGGDE